MKAFENKVENIVKTFNTKHNDIYIYIYIYINICIIYIYDIYVYTHK